MIGGSNPHQGKTGRGDVEHAVGRVHRPLSSAPCHRPGDKRAQHYASPGRPVAAGVGQEDDGQHRQRHGRRHPDLGARCGHHAPFDGNQRNRHGDQHQKGPLVDPDEKKRDRRQHRRRGGSQTEIAPVEAPSSRQGHHRRPLRRNAGRAYHIRRWRPSGARGRSRASRHPERSARRRRIPRAGNSRGGAHIRCG